MYTIYNGAHITHIIINIITSDFCGPNTIKLKLSSFTSYNFEFRENCLNISSRDVSVRKHNTNYDV